MEYAMSALTWGSILYAMRSLQGIALDSAWNRLPLQKLLYSSSCRLTHTGRGRRAEFLCRAATPRKYDSVLSARQTARQTRADGAGVGYCIEHNGGGCFDARRPRPVSVTLKAGFPARNTPKHAGFQQRLWQNSNTTLHLQLGLGD